MFGNGSSNPPAGMRDLTPKFAILIGLTLNFFVLQFTLPNQKCIQFLITIDFSITPP